MWNLLQCLNIVGCFTKMETWFNDHSNLLIVFFYFEIVRIALFRAGPKNNDNKKNPSSIWRICKTSSFGTTCAWYRIMIPDNHLWYSVLLSAVQYNKNNIFTKKLKYLAREIKKKLNRLIKCIHFTLARKWEKMMHTWQALEKETTKPIWFQQTTFNEENNFKHLVKMPKVWHIICRDIIDLSLCLVKSWNFILETTNF